MSGVLHSLVFISFLLSNTGLDSQSGQSGTDVTIQPKYTEADIVEIIPPGEGELEVPKTPHSDLKCTHYYGGIGITHRNGIVTKVYAGYPAELAGIRLGDTILNIEAIRGDVGTKVILEYLRSGVSMPGIEMVRDKICIDPPPSN